MSTNGGVYARVLLGRWTTIPSLAALMEPSQISPARDKVQHMKQARAAHLRACVRAG